MQILELKHNRKNESITSSWDTTNSWGTEPTAVVATVAPVTATSIPEAAPASTEYVKYRAIYEFYARNADEITFQPGDIVMVCCEFKN